jgi:deoxyhypusine monooxygenase
LKRFEDENKTSTMLWETCFLAKELINWNKETDNGKSENVDFKKLTFKTNDPAPPFNIHTEPIDPKHKDIENLT